VTDGTRDGTRGTVARWVLVTLAAAALLGSLGFAFKTRMEERREYQELASMGHRVRALRAAADSCRNHLAVAHARFLDFDERVDSLRRDVLRYEELDSRGVPRERYDEYLSRFDGYNDSVVAWQERARTLEADETACRELISEHNVLGDSLRRRLEESRGGG
jgi:hypothetical protein